VVATSTVSGAQGTSIETLTTTQTATLVAAQALATSTGTGTGTGTGTSSAATPTKNAAPGSFGRGEKSMGALVVVVGAMVAL
jgi:hypothetical protein